MLTRQTGGHGRCIISMLNTVASMEHHLGTYTRHTAAELDLPAPKTSQSSNFHANRSWKQSLTRAFLARCRLGATLLVTRCAVINAVCGSTLMRQCNHCQNHEPSLSTGPTTIQEPNQAGQLELHRLTLKPKDQLIRQRGPFLSL